ncbi:MULTISPECIES: DUF3593 domain-containing protein [Prochlorococcus]|uniref:DUF3593 domain-containing protein n=1 Tax=Prochlorococcus TaxID=1218 RepID=UPI000533989F|nr:MULTISPECIES: DUF3593 domain-containing protein [Prochlorococcus]KGG12489.1 hypothetical protein EV05_1701 [Prochlorococcus sp. MIT 0601]
MNFLDSLSIFTSFESIDPGPFFVISLIPYLAFLYWAQQGSLIPKTSLLGFKLTLLFVLVSIICSVFAKTLYNQDLSNVDPLHGGAELFLAISDGLVVLGFFKLLNEKS